MANNCDFTMTGLRDRLPEAFDKVTANTCKEIISKVNEQEKKYWSEDEMLDEIYAENAEEDYAGSRDFENQGEESCLEDM